MQNTHNEKKWYKQKWPWLIFSLPFLTVIAGIITFNIASDGADSLVKDDYFKEGLAINRSLGLTKKAGEIGAKAFLQVDHKNQLIILKLDFSKDEKNLSDISYLQLEFSHPTQKKRDRQIKLSPLTKNEFVADFPELANANWHVRLRDDKEQWQLKARWQYPEKSEITISATK